MSCKHCGPSKNSPEYYKKFKPENNSGCACGGPNTNDCDQPSTAIEGSPRWEWEQEHGKLITNIVKKIGDDGRFFLDVEKVPCGKPNTRQKRKGCCSLRYRVVR